jgi:hypothetical protein
MLVVGHFLYRLDNYNLINPLGMLMYEFTINPPQKTPIVDEKARNVHARYLQKSNKRLCTTTPYS